MRDKQKKKIPDERKKKNGKREMSNSSENIKFSLRNFSQFFIYLFIL